MKIENVAVISLDDYAEYIKLKKAKEKEELPNNVWYKHSDYDNVLIFKTGKREGCGIDDRCLWVDNTSVWSFYDRPASWRNATREEIEKALIKEAKKRGLVEGVRIKSRWLIRNTDGTSATPISNIYSYDPFSNQLSVVNSGHSYTLFKDGEWAEPVTEVDKFADIKKAYAEGAEIEFYSKVYGEWRPKRSNIWDGNVEYRIRPLKVGDWVYQDNKIYKIEHEVMKMSLQSDGWKRITDYELIDKLNSLAQDKD